MQIVVKVVFGARGQISINTESDITWCSGC